MPRRFALALCGLLLAGAALAPAVHAQTAPDPSQTAAACTADDARGVDAALFGIARGFEDTVYALERPVIPGLPAPDPVASMQQLQALRDRAAGSSLPACGTQAQALLTGYMDARLDQLTAQLAGDSGDDLAARRQTADAAFDALAQEFAQITAQEGS